MPDQPREDIEPTVSMKCKNPKCSSITAREVNYPAPGTNLYQCVKCKCTWAITVGGSFNLN